MPHEPLPIFVSYGEGTWSADLLVDNEPTKLCGVYTTDDWRIMMEVFE